MLDRKSGSETSERIAKIAAKGLKDPGSLTLAEIKEVCGSVLGQREPPTIPIRPRDLGVRPRSLAIDPLRDLLTPKKKQ